MSSGDTIVYGKTYGTKLYLGNDTLYKVAKDNGIADYLSIKYWDGDTSKMVANIAILSGDTGIVEFTPRIARPQTGETIIHTWEYRFEINFDPMQEGVDTIFFVRDFLYIKQK